MTRRQRNDMRNVMPRPDLTFGLRARVDAAVKVEGAVEADVWVPTHHNARGTPKRWAWVPSVVVLLTHAGRFCYVTVDRALMESAEDWESEGLGLLARECQPYVEHLLAEAAAAMNT